MSRKKELEATDCVGIEIEYTDFSARDNTFLIKYLRDNGYIITHDASVESPSKVFHDGIPIKGEIFDRELSSFLFRKRTIGGEIVSPIINTFNKKWIPTLDTILSQLKISGERWKSPRGSIHIHVNYYTENSRRFMLFLISSLVLATHYEHIFYRLGGFGREQRGNGMDFIYYRPITGNGPPIVTDIDGEIYYPLFDFSQVINSKKYEEFFYRFGGITRADGKYHPSRYLWINYYNLYHSLQKHLEFRVFNKTLRIDYLYAAVELCKAFTRLAINIADIEYSRILEYEKEHKIENIDSGALPDFYSPSSLLQAFPERGILHQVKDSEFEESLLLLDGLNDDVLRILENIWQSSPVPTFSNIPVFTHLDRRYVFIRSKMNPQSILNLNDVKRPEYFDVHELERQGINIFPEEL